MRALFGPLGGVELELPDRREFVERDPPDFSGPEWDRLIVLDTNVLSELAKAVPDRAVMAWANSQFADELYATAISEAEMLYGIDLLPEAAAAPNSSGPPRCVRLAC